MNPAANTATSAGVAGAIVEIADWVLSLCHIPAPPSSVDEAFGILLTALGGYYLHVRSQDPTRGLFLGSSKASGGPATPVAAPPAT